MRSQPGRSIPRGEPCIGIMVMASIEQSLVPPRLAVRVRRWPLRVRLAAGVLLLHALVAVTGPLWAPHSPTKLLVGPPFAPPSLSYPCGVDNLGRDVFSRVLYGERTDLSLALSATGVGVFLGTGLGMVTAYVQGGFDDVLMRVVDVLLSIPPLILALLVVNSLGYSATLLVCTLAFFYTPRVARVVRAATLGVVMEDFVAAAKARGESSWSIAARELFPNVVGVVFVEFAVRTAYAVTFIGSMGFLGFGPPAPAPEWGRMVNESREFIATAPWVTVAPAVAIASLVVALNVFTDGVAQGLSKVVQWEHR